MQKRERVSARARREPVEPEEVVLCEYKPGHSKPHCACARVAVNKCAFPLKGRKAGQVCGLDLCERCTREGGRCRAHHEYEKARA